MKHPVVYIDRLAFGGNGVGRIEGKVCFVPFSCPHDEVAVAIIAEKKSFSLAEIAEIITPSPFRVTPACPIYGICGGCNWQHIAYSTQLEQKRAIVADALRKGAQVAPEVVEDVVPAPDPYGYRSRMQFKVAARPGSVKIGFYRAESHQVVDMGEGCLVALPVINRVAQLFRKLLGECPDVALLRQISINAGHGEVVVTLHLDGVGSAKLRHYFLQHSAQLGECTGLFVASGKPATTHEIWGSGQISYQMERSGDGEPYSLHYPPDGFAQVNQVQNRAMLAVVRRLAAVNSTVSVLDLYCGNGNLSLPLAEDVAEVIGVEANAESIRAAQLNASTHSIGNAFYQCADVAKAVRDFIRKSKVFDVIIIDPPRSGAAEAAQIAQLKPQRIIYVSCDPSTLARDCASLKNVGYEVICTVPIDMFPQTHHIETVSLLQKREE